MSTPEQLPKILVVDDDESIRELLTIGLDRRGFDTSSVDGGKAMDLVLHDTSVNLIVLDSMMPGEDGLSICKRLSSEQGPPIIMLSAAGSDLARIKGLNLGAEDYMGKPFNMDELAARIRVVLRRRPMLELQPVGTSSAFGWTIENKLRRLISPVGKFLLLSSAEFAVLTVFFSASDRPLRREELLQRMAAIHEESTDRSLDALISRLRRKMKFIAQAGEKDLIQTVYGVGYMLRADPA